MDKTAWFNLWTEYWFSELAKNKFKKKSKKKIEY